MSSEITASPAWSVVQQSGVTWGEVDERPDGLCMVSAGECRVAFGPSPAAEESQQDGEGWDWTSYVKEDGRWVFEGGGWAGDDEEMADVLSEALNR